MSENASANYEGRWESFVKTLGNAGLKKIQSDPSKTMLKEPLEKLMDEILKFNHEFSVALSYESPVVQDLLNEEMAYFVERYQKLSAANSNVIDKALEDGDTVKGSIEDIIENLPRPLKKLLKILNEFLKLLGGS